jgi:hypothetical protein
VQQHEAANNAKEETTSAEIMRIMGSVTLSSVKITPKIKIGGLSAPAGVTGKGIYFVGVT